MKILITTDTYAPVVNGVVTSLLNLKQGLEDLGHEVRVLTLSNTSKTYTEGDVTYIASISGEKIYEDVRIRGLFDKKVMKELMAWGPDVVHSQSEFSTFTPGRKLAEKLEIPFIHTYHTIYEDYTSYFSPTDKIGKSIARKITRRAANGADALVAPTAKVVDIFKRYNIQTPTYVVPTGIQVKQFGQENPETTARLRQELNIPEDHTVVVSVSRICEEKSIDKLISYFQNCKNPKVTFVIVGDGPAKEGLEQQTKELHLEHRVKFTGMVPSDQVASYYHMGDLFVSASTTETQGLTYIEAMASGTPILCRQDTCLEKVLLEGINGFSFTDEDSFLERLDYICNHKDQWHTWGENGRRHADTFSIAHFAQAMVDVYQEQKTENEKLWISNSDPFIDHQLVNILSFVMMIFCVIACVWCYQKGYFTSIEALQELMHQTGLVAPLVFIVLQVIQVVFPIIPGGLGCLAGVLHFGAWDGFWYNYIGICIGSLIVFGISKRFGPSLIQKLFPRVLVRRYRKWTTRGTQFDKLFAIAIFVPVAPDDFLCYLAGTTPMSWARFTLIILTGKITAIGVYSLGLVMVWNQFVAWFF